MISSSPSPLNSTESEYLVSAFVPIYNAERFMRGLLEDLEAQTIADKLEIVIADTDSPTDERAIVQEFQERYDNIVYIRTSKRENPTEAFNRCAQLAQGKYVTLACTDDRHRPDALEIMAHTLEEHPEVGLVYADSLITPIPNETFASNGADRILRWPDFSVRQLLMYSMFGPQAMWRRRLHEEIGLPDSQYLVASDYEFFIRLAWKYGAYHVPEVLGLYYEGPGVERRHQSQAWEETRRVLKHYRSIIPIEDIYPALREASDGRTAKGIAMVDFANCLMMGLYPDQELAEHYYRQAIELLGEAPTILNNLALIDVARGQVEQSLAQLEALASGGYEPAQQNLHQIRTAADGRANLKLSRLHHPVLDELPPLMSPESTRAPRTEALKSAMGTPGRIAQIPAERKSGYSFCIISGGKRPQKLAQLIESIHAQKISHYEIIVAGIAEARSDITCIPMPDAAQTGRTSVLRNAAAARSQYDYIVFADDDIVLQPGWFAGLQPYVPDYDLLPTQLLNPDGTRHWDWATIGGARGHVMLDYDERDAHLYLTSGLCVVKARLWETIQWAEHLGFQEFEDVDFSQRALKAGFRVHFCKDSIAVHSDERYTQVGRMIAKRSAEGVETWLSGELGALTPQELTDRAIAELKRERAAEAADCLRYCLMKAPAHEPARQVWDSLVQAYGGATGGGAWRPHSILTNGGRNYEFPEPPSASLPFKGGETEGGAEAADGVQDLPRDVLGARPTAADQDLDRDQMTTPPSLLWHAPIFDPSGYADEARNFILSLHTQGFDLAAKPIGRHSQTFRGQLDLETQRLLDGMLAREPGPDFINVVHFPAYAFERVPQAAYNIGRVMFETDGLPAEWVAKCNQMDEIWVPTDFNMETFRDAGVTARFFKVPGGIDTEIFHPGYEPLPIPGARGTIFLSIFEWIYRKGWDVLLRAWANAFTSADDASLVLRTYPINATDIPDLKAEIEGRIDQFLHMEMGRRREEVAPIIVLGEQVPEPDMPRLYAAANAYVAPSRGEGWGRPHMQAMACGLPVIATGWSGNTEFMNDQNSLLIEVEGLEEIGEQVEIPFYRGQRWAKPSAEHLTALLRQVYKGPAEAAAIGERARQDMVERWQWKDVAKIPAERLQEIHTELSESRRKRDETQTKPFALNWEGSQFVHHSLAIVNRELCLALIQSGQCELNLIPYEPHQFGVEEDAERFPMLQERLNRPLDGPAEFHVRHQWPPNFEPPAAGHWIIMQPWEYGSMPAEWYPHFREEIDEIWVYTNYLRDCYIRDGIDPSKIAVVPLVVDFNRFKPDLPPLTKVNQRTMKKFKFLFVGGTIWRKGIDILLDAYTQAFSPDDNVALVIKDIGGESFYKGQNIADRIHQIQGDPNTPEIVYITEMLSDAEIPKLYTTCDCLVHPYRGGSADDFTSDETVYYIPAGRVNVRIDTPTVKDAWVLNPNPDALIEQMRYVVSHPDEAKVKGRGASEAIRSSLSWEKSAKIILDRLELLRSQPIRRFAPKAEVGTTVPIEPVAEAPATAEGYNKAAKQLYEAGNLDEAEAQFKRAIWSDRRFVEPYNNLAVLYLQKEEIGAALYKLTEALQLDPDYLDAVINYGLICKEIGCLDAARQTFETYLGRNPGAAEIEELLAEIST